MSLKKVHFTVIDTCV